MADPSPERYQLTPGQWVTVVSHWLTIVGVLLIWHRSRRREARSLWDPSFSRADFVAHLKVMAALAVVRSIQLRYLSPLPALSRES